MFYFIFSVPAHVQDLTTSDWLVFERPEGHVKGTKLEHLVVHIFRWAFAVPVPVRIIAMQQPACLGSGESICCSSGHAEAGPSWHDHIEVELLDLTLADVALHRARDYEMEGTLALVIPAPLQVRGPHRFCKC